MIGPYVGSDGGAITGLSLTQSTFMLSVNGAAFTAKQETTAGSHRILGYYSAMLNSSDTATAGRVLLVSSAAAAQPVWHEYTILDGAHYDDFITGSSGVFDMRRGQVLGMDMSSISGVQARSPVNALRALRNRVTTSGSILTVYKEDDVSSAWAAALTVNASASLIVESDPG